MPVEVIAIETAPKKIGEAVMHYYKKSGQQYPPMPAPQYMIDGKPFWDFDNMMAFGKAVENCGS